MQPEDDSYQYAVEDTEDFLTSPDTIATVSDSHEESPPPNIRDGLNRYRGWLLVLGMTAAQTIFAIIMILLRAEARPVADVQAESIRALAIDMLGHEVEIKQVYQLIPMRGGKRMTIGMDVTLVLGQLPEERVEGAPRPTAAEYEVFTQAIQGMEPLIRSRISMLLQQIPVAEYGSVEVYTRIKDDIRDTANDTLESLDFGSGLRQGIGKRRVTDVLLPMFVRQML